jgi:hypothetical protein
MPCLAAFQDHTREAELSGTRNLYLINLPSRRIAARGLRRVAAAAAFS